MAELLTFTVTPEEKGKRLDVFLSERGDMTRSAAVKLIEKPLMKHYDSIPRDNRL